MNSTKKILHNKVISFFCGCGGMDLGFKGGFEYLNNKYEKNYFEIISAYDNDEKCVMTYKHNIGNHVHVKDLSNVKPNTLPKADILIGGFPCQDFSSCGPKKGLSSSRGKLYMTLVNYMIEHQPMLVIAENVPHLAKIDGGNVLQKILKDFEVPGYKFELWKLYAPDYGIPQNRTRLFFVGVRNDIDGKPKIPVSTHSDKYLTIDNAIDDLMDIVDESIANQSQYFKASKAKRGNGQGDERSKAGKPSYTIRANAKSRMQFHYTLPRRLTVRECARLQTFPDDFVFNFSATTNVMQIGNAVPPLLAYHVGRSIYKFIKNFESKESYGSKSIGHYAKSKNS